MTVQGNANIMTKSAVASTSTVYSEDFNLDDTVTAAKFAFRFDVAGTVQVQYLPEGSGTYYDVANDNAAATANTLDRLVIKNPPRRGRVSFAPASQPYSGFIDLQVERAAR